LTITRSSRSGGLLGIYLNDHLAGATVGAELAHRIAVTHGGPADDGTLRDLAVEVAQDRTALLDMMGVLGVPVRGLQGLRGVDRGEGRAPEVQRASVYQVAPQLPGRAGNDAAGC
jgi:hypothetical protein